MADPEAFSLYALALRLGIYDVRILFDLPPAMLKGWVAFFKEIDKKRR